MPGARRFAEMGSAARGKPRSGLKYQHTLEPVAASARGGKTVVSAKLTGSFPGSPVTLDFVFTLEGGKIAALEIRS
jgi:hypothetical protein